MNFLRRIALLPLTGVSNPVIGTVTTIAILSGHAINIIKTNQGSAQIASEGPLAHNIWSFFKWSWDLFIQSKPVNESMPIYIFRITRKFVGSLWKTIGQSPPQGPLAPGDLPGIITARVPTHVVIGQTQPIPNDPQLFVIALSENYLRFFNLASGVIIWVATSIITIWAFKVIVTLLVAFYIKYGTTKIDTKKLDKMNLLTQKTNTDVVRPSFLD